MEEVAGGVMSELLSLLCGAVRARSSDQAVALLLSGGIDSTSVGIALQNVGKTVRAYTYRLRGYESSDLTKAIAIARHFGWHLTIITVPTADVARDFMRLAVEQRCRKKTQFENTFPLLYVLPRIAEAEIWSGWNADDHYGNTKNCTLRQKRMAREGASPAERKEAFDAERRQNFELALMNPESGDTWWYAHRLAADYGKRLLDPYLDEAIRQYFLGFDHEQLSSLYKPFVRQALADELRHLPKGSLTAGVQLQTGGGVDALFETLLHDPAINRFEKKYTKVSPLCQQWGDAVERRPEPFLAELRALPSRSAPVVTSSDAVRYRPYTMDDVHRASAARRFTAVSTFAGGGGSCIGFHLAGGRVVLASEFVPEARRTYAANFPDTPIDTRDIREVIADDASIKTFLARAGLEPGELDILNGSPPCCEFSTAGRGISDQNELRPYSDTKQKGMATLIFDFFKLARGARPRIVIGENVPSLAKKHGAFFQGALDTLRFADAAHTRRLYYVNSGVLSASGFGVPQDRRRLFFIGVRADVARLVGIEDDADVLALFPEPSDFPMNIRSALANLRQGDAEIDPWSRAAMTGSISRVISHFPPNPRRRLKLKDVGFTGDGRFSMEKCAWDLPAPTLQQAGQGPNGLSGAIHPEANRKFTIPELKRLTGLPDDYALTGTLAQAAERVCRMVPPRVMQAIAERIYERVLRTITDSPARKSGLMRISGRFA
jgi:DNA-cytosine methyltransferase